MGGSLGSSVSRYTIYICGPKLNKPELDNRLCFDARPSTPTTPRQLSLLTNKLVICMCVCVCVCVNVRNSATRSHKTNVSCIARICCREGGSY